VGEGRGAADGAGDAGALVERAGLEGLAIVVVETIKVTAHGQHVCKHTPVVQTGAPWF